MVVTAPAPPQPDDGVIEEARRRQHRRWVYGASAFLVLALIAALVLLVSSGSSHATGTRQPGGARAFLARDVHSGNFNVRLYPATITGVAAYCEAVEENGRTGGSACGDVPTAPGPFVGSYGFGHGGRSITVVVTLPEVASILVNGVRRVSPVAVPGLPYELRAARIETSKTESLPPAMKETVRREGVVLVAFDAQGHKLPEARNTYRRQARVLTWGVPSPFTRFSRGRSRVLPHPPSGPCQLAVNGLPGLIARAGQVAIDIHPFPGKLIGEAFLPCVETEYRLGKEPIRALVMLNATDPSERAGEMPGFHPLPAARGFFTEGGTLTAKRSGNAWLVVGQGSSLQQRIEVLRHLTATVHL
ncbi:MAG TPA: hypothetical protein VGX72_01445 [Solirubrobacteraceae bacterium]|jgi:hypothetical protein|nr:hypothetical protein [Solirubrobacteraceae bacterium]